MIETERAINKVIVTLHTEDEAAVTRKLTNMAQDGKTWEKMNA